MAEVINILTLEEALTALKRDEDIDNEIADMLPSIDAEIEEGTGIKWQEQKKIDPIAKAVAKLKLQLEVGLISGDLDFARLTYKMKQLQIRALRLSNELDEG